MRAKNGNFFAQTKSNFHEKTWIIIFVTFLKTNYVLSVDDRLDRRQAAGSGLTFLRLTDVLHIFCTV